jgi:hypothetical protein
LMTVTQLLVRCRGCQPNVQPPRVHWWDQKLVRFCHAVSFPSLLRY